MLNRTYLWWPLTLAIFFTGMISPAYAQNIDEHCKSIAEATLEAGRLRDTGDDIKSATEKLSGRFTETQIEAGANFAFTFKRLREFPLYDFSQTYCRVMVPTKGEVSDLAKMLLKHQLDRSVECVDQGYVEKRAFAECWNRQSVQARERQPQN